ncbi:hypothetical protein NX862_17475 [Rhodobacter sp. KR11]|uniref:hypothetical protein n=1 Tax=Rhodobacter sp. KR11 TaxID=2974588 RepID=UPI002222057F|nr:hypothetical protein [Rhodobacter sp. KR11]MCW1920552.1 hypothetical protein [Rhodobacter sp. KR11]
MPSVDGIETLTILMVGRVDGALLSPALWLGDLGALVQWIAPDIDELNGLARDGLMAPTHVVIDLDAMGGILPAFDSLRKLRDTRPDLPVILVSGDLAVDDFSLERLALCDASLRAPVAFSSLEYALTEAREVNNPAWVARLKDLRAGL